MMKKLLALCRNAAFLGALCLFLLTTTLSAITWGVVTTVNTGVAVASAVKAANDAARVRQAKAVMKTKAKARIRRAVVAIPVVGIGAMVYFEERNFREWKADNPDGTRQEYGCEVVEATSSVIEEVLQELPERVRPEPETVFKFIPKCESEQTVPSSG